jgi:hypothetical protein
MVEGIVMNQREDSQEKLPLNIKIAAKPQLRALP